MYVGVLGNDNPVALPVVELDLSKLPEGRRARAGAEVKWAKGTGAYRDAKSIVPDDLSEDAVSLLQTTALAVSGAGASGLCPIDMRLRAPAAVLPSSKRIPIRGWRQPSSRWQPGKRGAPTRNWLKRSSTSRSAGTAGPDLQGRIVPSVFHK